MRQDSILNRASQQNCYTSSKEIPVLLIITATNLLDSRLLVIFRLPWPFLLYCDIIK